MAIITYEQNIGTPNGGFKLKVEVTYEEITTENATYIRKVVGYVKRNNSSYYPYSTTSDCTFKIYGVKQDGTSEQLYSDVSHPNYNLGSDGYKTVLNKTLTNWKVQHLDDGSKKIGVYFAFDGKLSNYYPNGNILEQYTLPTIARANQIEVSAVDIDSNCSITIKQTSTKYKTTIQWKRKGQADTEYTSIVEKTDKTTVDWTVPTTVAQYDTTSQTIELDFLATTYLNDEVIGTYKSTQEMYATKTPILTVTAKDVNTITTAVTGNNAIVIKGLSNVLITANVATYNYATLKEAYVNSEVMDIAGNVASKTLNAVAVNEFKVVAGDSRGTGNVKSAILTMSPYTQLTLNVDVARNLPTDEKVNISCRGSYYEGGIGKTANGLSLEYRYKTQNGEFGNWISISNITKEGSGTINYAANVQVTNIDYKKTYVFEVRAQDALYNATNNNAKIVSDIKVLQGIPIVDWGEKDISINVVTNDFDMKSPYLSDNADNYKYSGLHMFGPNATGLPYSGYWAVFSIGKGDDCVQIAVAVLDTNARYIREVSGAWQVLGTNIVDNEKYEAHKSLNGTNVAGLRKNLGKLPNNTYATYSTGLSAAHKIADYDLYAIKGNQTLKLPFLALNLNNKIAGYLDDANTVSVATNWDASSYDLWIDIKFA